jgi:hypothetical protein
VARSPHLARLRLLSGVAELPIKPNVFLEWQKLVEEVCDADDLSFETACDVFKARFLCLGMCEGNSMATTVSVVRVECVQTPDCRAACTLYYVGS